MLKGINFLKPKSEKKDTDLKHLAISLVETKFLRKKDNTNILEALRQRNKLVKDIINLQLEKNIPVLTIYLLGKKSLQNSDYFEDIMESISDLFDQLSEDKQINENKIKIFALGKWYDLVGKVVASIKNAVEETKDYDRFFLNICINYDGQEEIVDATKILASKVNFDKITVSEIDKEKIKENLYSSYFIPPDKIVVPSPEKRILSFLLWDTAYTTLEFIEKDWIDCNIKDIERVL